MERNFTVKSNIKIAPDVFKMVLAGDCSDIKKPGQFVNIALEGLYLRRPISVSDVSRDLLTIIYKAVGKGTAAMSGYGEGKTLRVLSGLGNGFDIGKTTEKCVVIGGGVGVPPMYYLAKKLLENGKTVTAVLGFNKESEIFYKNEFEALGIKTLITTCDGSAGIRGFVTDALSEVDYDYTFACGPEAMLSALYNKTECSGQYSFESRMGCGFGACMGCSCRTNYGYKRICTDGPVLFKEEIIWQK